jgi:hypothetical protein
VGDHGGAQCASIRRLQRDDGGGGLLVQGFHGSDCAGHDLRQAVLAIPQML